MISTYESTSLTFTFFLQILLGIVWIFKSVLQEVILLGEKNNLWHGHGERCLINIVVNSNNSRIKHTLLYWSNLKWEKKILYVCINVLRKWRVQSLSSVRIGKRTIFTNILLATKKHLCKMRIRTPLEVS